MKVGKLRHFITIQQLADTTKDSFGHETEVWETFAQLDAEIKPTRGLEEDRSETTHEIITHEIYTRYVNNVTSKMRVQWIDNRAGITWYYGIEDVRQRHDLRDIMHLRTKFLRTDETPNT